MMSKDGIFYETSLKYHFDIEQGKWVKSEFKPLKIKDDEVNKVGGIIEIWIGDTKVAER
jgi:hypothetical protein